MNNPQGYVSFILHAHLPFIHHPESEDYLEEGCQRQTCEGCLDYDYCMYPEKKEMW